MPLSHREPDPKLHLGVRHETAVTQYAFYRLGTSAARAEAGVAAKTEGVLVEGAGSGTRAINFRPNAADPK